ncbi:MAG: toprim domain-containing protein [Dyadobacter sp.]|uniref:toprim domain-containing protein n=1 Tax=Dyadobacter sp. TaxID=1914288 RepID=UPI00326492B7
MITTEQRQSLKMIPITAYLASKGILPVVQSGGEYCYFSPFRKEKTPSFFVNIASNIYHDFAEPEKGTDNIKLVMKLDNCDFLTAVHILMRVDFSKEIELMQDLPASPQYQSFIKRIANLKHPALINYITKVRHIPFHIANSSLSEIHYTTSKGDFFSLGFKNISDGWELRNQSFKGSIGKKDISIRGNRDGVGAYVFEGFIDYLSFIAKNPKKLISTTFYILNSISLINSLPDLERYDIISLALDNDEKGKEAALKLCNKYPNAWNYSAFQFPKHKDFNDFLISTNDKTTTH